MLLAFSRLSLATSKARLSFEEFVRIFEEGQADSFKQGGQTDVEYPQLQTSRMSNAELETRLRQKVEEQADVLLSVRKFVACIVYCFESV
jgi:hypothetical protein